MLGGTKKVSSMYKSAKSFLGVGGGGGGRRGRRRAPPPPLEPTLPASKDDCEEEEEEEEEEEDGDGGDVGTEVGVSISTSTSKAKVYQIGPSRLSRRPIAFHSRPVVRPHGDR